MRTENLAIAFVDIVGFTARTSQQSREENEKLLERFAQVVRPLVVAFGGSVVKSIGDAFLLTFRSPTDALHCGMALHDRLAESNAKLEPRERFDIRVAVNVGEVRVESGDVFGEPVNIASRIEGEAGAGEVVFSEAVCLVMTKSEIPYEEIGVRELKGIAEPVKLYRVPRVGDGGYRLKAEGAPAGGDPPHPLAAPLLPYGGVALERVRGRLGPDPVTKAKEAIARVPWSSKPVRYGVAAALLLLVISLITVAVWPERKKKTPWERFKQEWKRSNR